MALMLLLGNVPVLAASKITLKSGAAAPSSIYTGHSYTLKVAGTAVKWYSSNKKVATIGLTTGKLKPVQPGTVKITAKSKKTGKTVATKTFKVLQRAIAVSLDQTELSLVIRETAVLKATKTPSTSTDVLKFFSQDKTVATVGMTSGKVTAKGRGSTVITVYSMATKAASKYSRYNKIATCTVTVQEFDPCIICGVKRATLQDCTCGTISSTETFKLCTDCVKDAIHTCQLCQQAYACEDADKHGQTWEASTDAPEVSPDGVVVVQPCAVCNGSDALCQRECGHWICAECPSDAHVQRGYCEHYLCQSPIEHTCEGCGETYPCNQAEAHRPADCAQTGHLVCDGKEHSTELISQFCNADPQHTQCSEDVMHFCDPAIGGCGKTYECSESGSHTICVACKNLWCNKSGGSHVTPDCGKVAHRECVLKDAFNANEHKKCNGCNGYLCDGANHDHTLRCEAGCGAQVDSADAHKMPCGHYSCQIPAGSQHELLTCGTHYQCNVEEQDWAKHGDKCSDCLKHLCLLEGEELAKHQVFDCKHYGCVAENHAARSCNQSGHYICIDDGKSHSRCDATDGTAPTDCGGWLCDDSDHTPCPHCGRCKNTNLGKHAALPCQAHYECTAAVATGEAHSATCPDCGKYYCTMADRETSHPTYSCGHDSCRADKHGDAACGMDGHFVCDNLNHGVCAVCNERLCSGNHGEGLCGSQAITCPSCGAEVDSADAHQAGCGHYTCANGYNPEDHGRCDPETGCGGWLCQGSHEGMLCDHCEQCPGNHGFCTLCGGPLCHGEHGAGVCYVEPPETSAPPETYVPQIN